MNLQRYLPIHLFSWIRTSKLDGGTYNEVERETHIEWLCIFNALSLFRGEGYIQRLKILLKMLDLPSTDNGENIRCFLQNIRNRD